MKELLFAWKHRSKLSTAAFFYLLNGGKLPAPKFIFYVNHSGKSGYIQSYIRNGKVRMQVIETIRHSAINDTILQTMRFGPGSKGTYKDFYFRTLNSLAKHYG